MADVKKTTARKTATVKTAAKKEVEKLEAAVKEEAVKAAAEVKEEVKAAAKKAPAKKAPAKKAEHAIKSEIVIQFNGNDYTPDRLVQSAKDVWLYDMGRDLTEFKSVELYVKPEESKVYAVVNETETISFII